MAFRRNGDTDLDMFASASVDLQDAGPRFEMLVFEQRARSLGLDEVVRETIETSETLEESAGCLLRLIQGGYSVWTDGRLLETRALVERLGRMKIVIHTREHGPPHFHVEVGEINASFAIDDCRLLHGEVDGRNLGLVRYWHKAARPLLVRKWNETRPSDCPVGPIST